MSPDWILFFDRWMFFRSIGVSSQPLPSTVRQPMNDCVLAGKAASNNTSSVTHWETENRRFSDGGSGNIIFFEHAKLQKNKIC
jgi:hypothetical protein